MLIKRMEASLYWMAVIVVLPEVGEAGDERRGSGVGVCVLPTIVAKVAPVTSASRCRAGGESRQRKIENEQNMVLPV